MASIALYTLVFQFTTSRGGRHFASDDRITAMSFQFTTSRGGRLLTHLCFPSFQFPFNSRPHEEVDLELPGLILYTISFNSRPHEEVDWSFRVIRLLFGLSIHDLTRRSTKRLSDPSLRCSLSIHDLTRRSTTSAL